MSSLMSRSSPVALRAGLAVLLTRRQLGIGITQFRQVRRAWPRVQLCQQAIMQRFAPEPGDTAVRIVDVTKDDRPGRACRLAGSNHVSIADAPVLLLRLDARHV